jgi:hypothetical protein
MQTSFVNSNKIRTIETRRMTHIEFTSKKYNINENKISRYNLVECLASFNQVQNNYIILIYFSFF